MRSRTMKNSPLIMRNSVFAWIALGTGFVLLVPLLAMQVTEEVNCGILDFVTMGALLFSAGSIFVLIARKVPRKYWLAIGLLIALIVLYVWAELAVGVLTNLGS
jgi:uncharacterized membrane protein